ncbi:hypothetical protein EAI_13058 [Harpegnathos saltator]|uniref:Uncharacterized protein n=1 Tax=Harpegnathos saltator TaxID=610380 RepID=E2B6C0_HARSA|nr:hypothetical protein EAI_13058 [Harpegnathos saltator]
MTELEVKNAETQTKLSGFRKVEGKVEVKEIKISTLLMLEASIMSKKELIEKMRIPMPILKTHRAVQTDRTIAPGAPREAVENLAKLLSSKKDIIPGNPIDKYTIMEEILNYVIECTLWATNLLLYDYELETVDQEVQTDVRYDKTKDKMVIDIDVQTELTCEPRLSTGKLFVQYEEVKNFIRKSILEQCIVRGIEPRIIIDDLLNEIIAKGVELTKYPVKEQMIQTVASYKSHLKCDEDVLRKLKISVVVDPAEIPIIVAPLINDLLTLTRVQVSWNAQRVVKDILCTLTRRAVTIGCKLEAILRQPQRLTTEQMFLQRRKKIADSMMKKLTETRATQTGLAGVPEITKLKPKNILCSVCPRESICHLCLTSQEERPSLPKEDTRILRTQDILLAYNPCYVVATASEEKKRPYLQSSSAVKKKIEKPTVAQLPITQCVMKPRSEIHSARDNDAINVLMTPKKRTQARDSISEWARAIDDTLTKSWYLKDAASNVTNVSTTGFVTSSSKSTSCCKKSSQEPESVLNSQMTKALQILKNTFCTRDTCPNAFLRTSMEHHPPIKDTMEKSNLSNNVENCAPLNPGRHHHGQHINNINGQIRAKPR